MSLVLETVWACWCTRTSLLALTTLLVAACGGGSSTAPAAASDTVLAASQPDELLAHVKSLMRARDEQRQVAPGIAIDGPGAAGALAVSATGAALPHSNTTVQEAGVDEEDLMKTDGTSVYALDTVSRIASGAPQPRLLVHRRGAGGEIVPVQVLPLPVETAAYVMPRGLLLAAPARRMVALSESLSPVGDPMPCGGPGLICPALGAMIYAPFAMQSSVQLQFVDLDGTGNATLGMHATIDGRLVGSRLIGNVLFLVTTHSPRLAFDLLPPGATAPQKEAELAKLTTADFLPAWRAEGAAAQSLVAATHCYVQPTNRSLALEVTTITAIDVASSTLARASRCFVGGTEALYMAPESLYLATTRYPYTLLATGRLQYAPLFTTDLHKFSVQGLAIDYRASGTVNGHLGWDTQRKPYRLGEYNDDLRVLTFTGETGWMLFGDETSGAAPPSPATLTVLRESTSDKTLATVATLPNSKHPEPLGKAGEQVYGVRFTGARGYLVTFRTVDPLYVLDLTDPADPRAAGSLEVPGFSDYLFPLTDALLFGVGRDVDASGRLGGVKLGLFDVGDASQPKSLATRTLGSAGSQSALDFSSHGINFLQSQTGARVGLPVILRATPFDASPQHGLQRIEIDTQARAMTVTSLLAAPAGPALYPDLASDRSLQLGPKIVYLSQGQVVVADW